jgi:hypothetical protein
MVEAVWNVDAGTARHVGLHRFQRSTVGNEVRAARTISDDSD